MWMNIYIKKNKCDCCSRSDLLHIGKASSWWEFTFKGYNCLDFDWSEKLWMKYIMSYRDIKKAIKKCKIVNEYWEYISEKEFKELVKSKKKLRKHEITLWFEHSFDNEWNYFAYYEFS